jgi:hypothetical protein
MGPGRGRLLLAAACVGGLAGLIGGIAAPGGGFAA